jgi:phytol kinase
MNTLLTFVAAFPPLGMALEALALTLLLLGLRQAQRRLGLSAELARKGFHIGGGLSTLAFPWLFHSPWPVLALAPVTVGAFLALRYLRGLRLGLGNVLYGVGRRSLGEVYMPLSLTLVWLLSGGDALRFCLPTLCLTLADPAAALVGMRVGRHRYAGVDGAKSVEGSAACALVAAVCVVAPLLAVGGATLAHALALALTVALIVTLAEAVAWRGLDNLLIPLVAFGALRGLAPLPTAALMLPLALTLLVTGAAYAWRHQPGPVPASPRLLPAASWHRIPLLPYL